MSNDLGSGPSQKGSKDNTVKKLWRKILRKEDSQQLEEEVMLQLHIPSALTSFAAKEKSLLSSAITA